MERVIDSPPSDDREAVAMSVESGAVLPLLLGAILANTFVMAYVLFSHRSDARTKANHAAAVDLALSTAHIDRLERMTEYPPEPSPARTASPRPPLVPVMATVGQPSDPADTAPVVDAGTSEAQEPEGAMHPSRIDLSEAEAEAGADAATTEPEVPAAEPAAPLVAGIVDAATFRAHLAIEEERLRRYRHPMTIAILELDGLDRLVDRLGDAAADRIVPAMADTIRRSARGADVVAQVGRGRFAMLLPETDEIAAINVIERIRLASELWLQSGAIALRLAIGWAGTNGDLSLTGAEQVALQRMHVAARRDRGRDDLPVPVATDVAPEAERGESEETAEVIEVGPEAEAPEASVAVPVEPDAEEPDMAVAVPVEPEAEASAMPQAFDDASVGTGHEAPGAVETSSDAAEPEVPGAFDIVLDAPDGAEAEDPLVADADDSAYRPAY